MFCLASRSEGSPNVLSEALSCGCPAIATDVGAVREILTNGFLREVVSNKSESLLPVLMKALSTEYDRRAIAHHMKKFDWDWCARKVVDVYCHVLERES